MVPSFLRLILVAAVLFISPVAVADAVTMPDILTRLPNGLEVVIIKDKRFPMACSRLYVRAGSATEDPELAGISHVLEHMVFKGTNHRPKGQVAKDVEAMGGYLNAATSFDKTWYITDMPAEHWRLGMDVVKDMAFQASLDAKELEAEKNVVISELERGEDSPMRKLFESLQTATLKNTPYGRPIIGFVDSIRAITADDLKNYVRRWYQPQNMMLLVAGDIDPAEVLAYAQTLFGDLKNSTDLPVPEPINLDNVAGDSTLVEVYKGPWQKVYLGLALPAPALGDLRSIGLDVLAYLLGGDGTSMLYRKYKYDQQLVDSIDVSNMSMARAGMLVISATLDAANVDKFWQSLTDDLAHLTAASFSKDDIERAKFNLEDSMERAGETLNGLAAWQGAIQFDLGGEEGLANIRYAQQNVNQDIIQEAITNWLDSDQLRVRVLAPEKADLPNLEEILKKNWPASAKSIKAGISAETGKEEVIELAEGCRLLLIPDKSAPYLSMELLMPGGNAILKPDQQGLAALTARLLTDGCGEMNNMALERWLAERAGSISARAGLETFGISLEGPSRFNEDFFHLFHTLLFKPRFDSTELAREVKNMKAAIIQRQDQPLSYMFARLNPFLFPGGQPYGYDNLGDLATLETFNTMAVRDFWARQGGQPWVLAAAGDFDREAIIKFAKKLASPHTEKFSPPSPRWDTKKTLRLTLPGRNQAHLMRIFKTVPATHPDAPALMLLQTAISGQSGVLFTQLRDEEGLGYTVTAFNRSMPQAGFLALYIGTTPDKMEQAGKGFDRIVESLREKQLPAETLKAAANRLLGDYVRDHQSLASRSAASAVDAVLGRPRGFQRQLIEAAGKLTPQDVLNAAKKYLVSPYEVTLVP